MNLTMKKFIKVIWARGEQTTYVNVANILYFNESKGFTTIRFCASENLQTLNIVESSEEVLRLINDGEESNYDPNVDIWSDGLYLA